ncbi:hypothetical protein FF38_02212 [Lucilia cuprina]|uniref:Uncharacterized protein n=1 Tax=Lucilia cuprina TaxID=7375 RepID=A0A0L0BW17_LUCCU|nr:hypothetical protein FF38_02212 [Lucilia cuprina]
MKVAVAAAADAVDDCCVAFDYYYCCDVIVLIVSLEVLLNIVVTVEEDEADIFARPPLPPPPAPAPPPLPPPPIPNIESSSSTIMGILVETFVLEVILIVLFSNFGAGPVETAAEGANAFEDAATGGIATGKLKKETLNFLTTTLPCCTFIHTYEYWQHCGAPQLSSRTSSPIRSPNDVFCFIIIAG